MGPEPASTLSPEDIERIIRELDESQAEPEVPADRSTPTEGGRATEHRRVLDEIDQLMRELGTRAPAGKAAGNPAPAPVPESPPPHAEAAPSRPAIWDESPMAARAVSPYLEERLTLASNSMLSVGQEVRELGERWQRLQGTVELLERELGNASREVEFIRTSTGMTDDSRPVGPLPLPTAAPVATPKAKLAPAPLPPGGPSYLGFTAARYNSTIDGLKSRRRRLALWTVVVAAGISTVLVLLTLWAREPMPAWWLAVLPGIWMLPVPFFVLSFFGTQRVLRRNHLNVAGDP